MSAANNTGIKLGINGLGRIGKLTVWHHVGRKYFAKIVVNIGREAGTSLADIAHYLERDSTYGYLCNYLYGHKAEPVISDLDEAGGSMKVDGIPLKLLRTARNPREINWRDQGVKLVVDTTGRGHLDSGAEKVIVSAPFKMQDKSSDLSATMPDDAVTTVMGINTNDYDPRRHRIISNASCTTNCLAHMIKPLLNYFGPKKILTASMATVHAATGSQQLLDRLPKTGKRDLRKSRSIMNNIILTTTGAAKALRLVIPEMEQIGFIAESVRVPITTGSLIILVMDLQEEMAAEPVNRELINGIYKQAAEVDPHNYLHYTKNQNVSGDIIGVPTAAAIIEGHETHTRTAEISIDLEKVPGLEKVLSASNPEILRIPVTQAVIYGWYDNELGSYVNMFGDRTVSVAEHI
jgi:glyceraldehyde 3-phosphate dehydrogenase